MHQGNSQKEVHVQTNPYIGRCMIEKYWRLGPILGLWPKFHASTRLHFLVKISLVANNWLQGCRLRDEKCPLPKNPRQFNQTMAIWFLFKSASQETSFILNTQAGGRKKHSSARVLAPDPTCYVGSTHGDILIWCFRSIIIIFYPPLLSMSSTCTPGACHKLAPTACGFPQHVAHLTLCTTAKSHYPYR